MIRRAKWLNFSRRERSGIYCLAGLTLIIGLIPRLVRQTVATKPVSVYGKGVGPEQVGSTTGNGVGDIDFSNAGSGADHAPAKPSQRSDSRPRTALKPPGRRPLEINQADSVDWVRLRGIGTKLAGRILRFRERLGGFYSVEQLREVYGLPDSVFRALRPLLVCDSTRVRRLDINTASRSDFSAHPYFRGRIGDLLTAYRKQHGRFASPADLEKLEGLSVPELGKLLPYVSAGSSTDP